MRPFDFERRCVSVLVECDGVGGNIAATPVLSGLHHRYARI
jgi:hypothetical protein